MIIRFSSANLRKNRAEIFKLHCCQHTNKVQVCRYDIVQYTLEIERPDLESHKVAQKTVCLVLYGIL